MKQILLVSFEESQVSVGAQHMLYVPVGELVKVNSFVFKPDPGIARFAVERPVMAFVRFSIVHQTELQCVGASPRKYLGLDINGLGVFGSVLVEALEMKQQVGRNSADG